MSRQPFSIPQGYPLSLVALAFGVAIIAALGVQGCDSDRKRSVNGGEAPEVVCEVEDLRGETCESQGFFAGELLCLPDQSGFDTSGCNNCGDGLIDPEETFENCCVDVGCPEGVCDAMQMRCMGPWEIQCPEELAGSCSEDRPWLCSIDELPEYDCGSCGCPDGTLCEERFCYEPEVIAAERSDRILPMDLPIDRYFELYDMLNGEPALTLSELSELLDTLLREDRRRMALLLGESHNSSDEQAIGIQLMRNLMDGGWAIAELGIESHTLSPDLVEELAIPTVEIQGDLTNTAYCRAAVAGVENRLNDSDGLYLQYTGSGHTSREVAYHMANWTISEVPHTSECIARQGRKAMTVILFDANIWLWLTDQILLWRLGSLYPEDELVAEELDAAITRWGNMVDAQVQDDKFDTMANGVAVNVRVVEARTPNVFFAFIPRPNRPAYFLRGYRTLWEEAAIRTYLLSNDIQPGNCSISWNLTPGQEELGFWCNKGDKTLSATVDAISFSLLEWSAS